MQLTVGEMSALCVLHKGTISATLDALREAKESGEASESMDAVISLTDKLSRMKPGDTVSLAFDPES
jgi:hypothetical protein